MSACKVGHHSLVTNKNATRERINVDRKVSRGKKRTRRSSKGDADEDAVLDEPKAEQIMSSSEAKAVCVSDHYRPLSLPTITR